MSGITACYCIVCTVSTINFHPIDYTTILFPIVYFIILLCCREIHLLSYSTRPLAASYYILLIVARNRRVNDQFDDWGAGRGCNIFVPVLGGNGTKIAPTEDIFDQPPGQMR